LGISFLYAQDKQGGELTKEEILSIATVTIKNNGIDIKEVNIIYDDGNKLWSEEIGSYKELDNSPNFGILKKGFLKNYRTVYFDFKEPLPDMWVFIDKDTGEVLEVYTEK